MSGTRFFHRCRIIVILKTMPTLVTTYIWDSKSHGTQVPKILIGPMGLQNPMGLESQLVPKLGIWLSQRFLSRDCPSDICPNPKRPRRISPNPGPKSRDSCPGTQIPWDSRPIAHRWSLYIIILTSYYNFMTSMISLRHS